MVTDHEEIIDNYKKKKQFRINKNLEGGGHTTVSQGILSGKYRGERREEVTEKFSRLLNLVRWEVLHRIAGRRILTNTLLHQRIPRNHSG